MLGKELIKHIENWAPPGAAWEKDNIGVQIGDPSEKLQNVFLCLELTDEALDEAISQRCNFIFTHHPFIFKPLKSLKTGSDPKAAIIKKLIKNDITLYSAHTNLDFTKNGVSFVLAEKLGLTHVDFLENQTNNQYKIVVFAPEENSAAIADAMSEAGGGIIGNYSRCYYRSEGKGSFEGNESSSPALGKKENFETVNETRIEILVNKWKLNNVINSMLEAHPYEQPAYDVYPLQNINVNYGSGTIGTLPAPMDTDRFLHHISKELNLTGLRYTKGSGKQISRVAVCGGSGAEYFSLAAAKGADALVTSDVKYHTFQDAENNILLVDAGHYETEIPVLEEVEKRFTNLFRKYSHEGKVFRFTGSTNPIKFYNIKSGEK